MSETKVATLESEWTDYYVVRVVHKDGQRGFLGFDALGPYTPDLLQYAMVFSAIQRDEAMRNPALERVKQNGGEAHWCRIILAVAE